MLHPVSTKHEPIQIRVADYYTFCGTRDRARSFLSEIHGGLSRNSPRVSATLSFHGVRYVSRSFIEEVVRGLLRDEPRLLASLYLEGLTSSAVRRLGRATGDERVPVSTERAEGRFILR